MNGLVQNEEVELDKFLEKWDALNISDGAEAAAVGMSDDRVGVEEGKKAAELEEPPPLYIDPRVLSKLN